MSELTHEQVAQLKDDIHAGPGLSEAEEEQLIETIESLRQRYEKIEKERNQWRNIYDRTEAERNGYIRANTRLEAENERLRTEKGYCESEVHAVVGSRVRGLQDKVDLWHDEFKRVLALDASDEVNGICQRAISDIKRHVPLIQERDTLQQTVARLREENAKACEIIKSGFQLGTITQADLDWAQQALAEAGNGEDV